MLRIQRLSGDSLPMDQCYINLALVEQRGEQIDRSSGRDGEPSLRPSPFSLDARLKVETPHKDLLVTLPKLFDQRKSHSGDLRQPKRILIRGRAGIGKTTLCKKIVHDFTHRTMWQDQFQRLIWVQLRDLKTLEKHTLSEMLQHIHFQENTSEHVLYNVLAQHIEQTESRDTLFLLDGLDEVSDMAMWRQHSPQHAGHAFLKALLNKPNLIITTRPNTALPSGCGKPDLELDTVGFSPDEVNKYLEKVVSNKEKVVSIQSFLRKNRLMQSLVRIPIQLDALCFVWTTASSDIILQTMTAVYAEITRQLWRKDVERLGIVEGPDLRNILPSAIDHYSSRESNILGKLAFSGLRSNTIEFQQSHQDALCKSVEHHTQNTPLERMFDEVSFLRYSNPSAEIFNRNYHFIHLTFQEYFAATYFVQKWNDGQNLECINFGGKTVHDPEISCMTFLQQHKYTARYEIMWRFVTGLLDTRGDVTVFFDMIRQEPVDLLGPAHQRLVIHCLNEAVNLPACLIRSEMEEQLSKWLFFEDSLTGRSFLASEPEFPDTVLCKALVSFPAGLKVRVLESLIFVNKEISNTAITTLTTLLEDDESSIRRAAAEVIGKQSSLPEPTITTLTTLLEDDEWIVRETATRAIGEQSSLPEPTITTLATLLKHDDWSVRESAAEAIGKQSSLSESTMTTLTTLLKHNNGFVRGAAVRAIGKQSSLPESTIMILATLLKQNNWSVRKAAAEAIGKQSGLPESTIMTLATLLEDDEWIVREAATRAIGKQSSLPESTITTLTTLLEDDESSIRRAAAEVIGKQSRLPEPTITTLIVLLNHKDGVIRRRVVVTLCSASIPLENIFISSGWLLTSQRSPLSIGPVSLNLCLMESFYEVLLRRSFWEQLSLYFDGNICYLDHSSGLWKAALEQNDARRFRAAIERRKDFTSSIRVSYMPGVNLEP
jgi:HEAT repeat protein/Cdc6-like AAA superfamily ATPase